MHYVNVAKGKPAWQAHTAHGGLASYAVDGSSNPDYYGTGCTHTNNSDPSGRHWWQVDLLGVYTVARVQITNREHSACEYGSIKKRPWRPAFKYANVKFAFLQASDL